MAFCFIMNSCADLNLEPESTFAPDKYFNTDTQLQSYVNSLYSIFPSNGSFSYGVYGWDNGTDNMNNKGASARYVPGQWLVPQTGGEWEFSTIYKINYFFDMVMPKYEAGVISGGKESINHSIGEMHFIRAYAYFEKLKELGDFPIVTTTLENDEEILIQASKRAPRTEVAKFILSELDKAIELLKSSPVDNKNRLSKEAAYMFKSRVALFEASWMKNFKNTPFVPGGPNWPGASKEYNSGYTINNYDAYVDSLFQVCMDASVPVIEKFPLTPNNGILQQTVTDPANQYLNMYASVELGSNPEVVIWRAYNYGLGLTHQVPIYAQFGGDVNGVTRGYVDNFLMSNGLPIYAAGSGYQGDDYISDVRISRDNRLQLFLKEPGQVNILFNTEGAEWVQPIEPYPDILSAIGYAYGTGYSIRKGGTFDVDLLRNHGGCYTAYIMFRSAEAYLNYIEACYEKNGSLNSQASNYWIKIRERANLDTDYNKTIAATDMIEEALNDWGAYTAGVLLNDKILYNIRRERRSEFFCEGYRMDDLKRWRSLDQLIDNPYHLEGFKLWGPMQNENIYKNEQGKSLFVYEGPDSNVSSPEVSMYLRPQEINPLSPIKEQGGCKWMMGYYLSPIAMKHFLLTGDGNAANSVIYQNPYWSLVAGESATK